MPTMRAMVAPRYGTPDVLKARELERPTPGTKDVLVQVNASLVTAADCAFLSADPAMVRLIYGLRRPRHPVLGVEFAGEVAAIGLGVAHFAVGDRVAGSSPRTFGAHAEFLVIPESGIITHTPDTITDTDAVALLEAATAVTFFTRVAPVTAGQRVLVIGASGSVGANAVQFARYLGADVTAACSAANAQMVRELGASRVIDYEVSDPTNPAAVNRAADPANEPLGSLGDGDYRYDVILDAVGASDFSHAQRVLAPGGIYLSTVPSFPLVLRSLVQRRGTRARFAATGLMQSSETIASLFDLAERGALVPVIDRRYPLADLASAFAYVGSHHKHGSVVIEI